MVFPLRPALAAGIAVALLAGPKTPVEASGNGAQAPGARELYQAARRLETQLRASASGQRQRDRWIRVGRAYRKVVVSWPRSGYCDDALYYEGGIYRDAAAKFRDRGLAARSADSYAQLVRGYPSSRWVPKALYEQVALYLDPLDRPTAARRAARRLRERAADGPELRRAEALLNPPTPRTTPARAASPTSEEPAARPPAEEPAARKAAASVPAAGPEVRNIRHWVGRSHTRVVIDLSGPAQHTQGRLQAPPRVFFDFPGATLSEDIERDAFPISGPHLRRIRVGRFTPEIVRVVLDFSSVRDVTVFDLPDPYRLVVDIHGTPGAVTASAPAEEPEPDETPPVETAPAPPSGRDTSAPDIPEPTETGYSLARQLGAGVRRIVLDAGHGGRDPGTRAGSLREKDIVLDIAKRVRDNLVGRGFEVVMTRDRDVFIPLEQRAFIANDAGSDIFVSIHANAARNRRARGLETYYLNLATSPDAAEVAARENASASGIRMSDMPRLLKQILNHNRVEESRELATTMQAALAERLLGKTRHPLNRGVKTAGFHVLLGAQMAAILVEVGFVSNAAEAKQLRTGAHREKLAEAISDGIARYASALGQSGTRVSGPPKP